MISFFNLTVVMIIEGSTYIEVKF